MYQINCACCGKSFMSKRYDAKNCGDACRRGLSRKRAVCDFEDVAQRKVAQIIEALEIPEVSEDAQIALENLQNCIIDALDQNP